MSKRTAATSVATRASMFACALGLSFSLLGIPAASAITWNFNTPDAPALPNTTLGTTQTYTVAGLPPALLLFGTALAGLGILGRRRKKQHPAQAV